MSDFEPTRLTLAMRKRGVTQRQLAEMCNVSSQFISQVEKGRDRPTPERIDQFAEVLSFQSRFFFGPPLDLIPQDAVSFRASASMTSPIRQMGLGTADLAVSVIEPELNDRYVLPKVDVPDMSNYEPEEAANLLRIRWKLGWEPIQNMVHLAESKGISVYWLDNDSPSLDAVSLWRDKKPFALLSSHKQAGDRARFDLAHELGHLVLHRRNGTLIGRDVEKEADQFAGAFLLPSDAFLRECPQEVDFHELYRLKLRWKVSVAAMIMRAHGLGLFTDVQRRNAFQRMNATGTLAQEKAAFQRERSKLHPMIFEALAGRRLTPEDFATSLSLDIAQILELMPTGKLYMPSLQERKIINLDQRRRAS